MATHTMNDGIVDRALLNIRTAEGVIPTGFRDLDEKIEGGLQGGYLYVLGGRPGIGKTAFALNIVLNVLKKGKKVLYYCLQIPPEKLVKRMIITEAHGENGDLREAADEIRKYDLILENDPTFCFFGESYDNHISYEDVSLIVVDDLQHISMDYEPGGVSYAIKEKAQQKSIPILLLTNLSESVDERHLMERRPILADLHDVYYGNPIAEYSDVVMLLYRDEYYNPETEMKAIAEINVAKNSTGRSGNCKLVYIGDIMKFANIVRCDEL